MEIKTQDLVWQKPILGTIQKFLNNKPIVMQILKFAAIGVLNTAIDFIILNFISKTLEISSGFRLGTINVFGFIVAVVQSYFWNQAWTFGSTVQSVGLAREALRLLLIGCLGAGSIVAVLAASQIGAAPIVYFILLVGFVVAELALWYSFGLRFDPKLVANSQNFLSFILFQNIFNQKRSFFYKFKNKMERRCLSLSLLR